jgi:hypothetical protein
MVVEAAQPQVLVPDQMQELQVDGAGELAGGEAVGAHGALLPGRFLQLLQRHDGSEFRRQSAVGAERSHLVYELQHVVDRRCIPGCHLGRLERLVADLTPRGGDAVELSGDGEAEPVHALAVRREVHARRDGAVGLDRRVRALALLVELRGEAGVALAAEESG